MSALARTLTRITVGLAALFFTGLGTAAFAAVPVPDPSTAYNGGFDRGNPTGLVVVAPPAQHPTQAAVSGVSTLTLLLLITAAIVVAVVATQAIHRLRTNSPTRAVAA